MSDVHLIGLGGIVVTTGTDSIEEVAAWLAYRERWPVPIAVTGAMVVGERPDSDIRLSGHDRTGC